MALSATGGNYTRCAVVYAADGELVTDFVLPAPGLDGFGLLLALLLLLLRDRLLILVCVGAVMRGKGRLGSAGTEKGDKDGQAKFGHTLSEREAGMKAGLAGWYTGCAR